LILFPAGAGHETGIVEGGSYLWCHMYGWISCLLAREDTAPLNSKIGHSLFMNKQDEIWWYNMWSSLQVRGERIELQ